MRFHVVEKLPNLIKEGLLNKIYAEIVTETKQNAQTTTITGFLIVTRELRVPKSRSEITIKDPFPIDITVPDRKKIIDKAKVSLNIRNVNFSFDNGYTEFSGEFEITNVVEDTEQYVQI